MPICWIMTKFAISTRLLLLLIVEWSHIGKFGGKELKDDLVSFKGVNNGVYIDVKGDNLEDIKKSLDKKIKSALKFFGGINFLGVRSDELSPEDIYEIKMILKYKYDFNIPDEEIYEVKEEDSYNNEGIEVNISEEGMTKFLHGTIRSGQEVIYNGNIVVIGDVNPGAFLKAEGNIIVLGSLRGVAHAGIGGNENCIVAAYSLLPTQLGIGETIVRPPEGDVQYNLPEVARIINDEVFIEPYLPNK